MEKRIVISKGTELFLIPARRLVYISSDGNYSNAVTQDGRSLLLSYQLGQLEDMIADQLGDTGFDFVRLGRRLIVNMDFVHYIDVARQLLHLPSSSLWAYFSFSIISNPLSIISYHSERSAVILNEAKNLPPARTITKQGRAHL